MPEPESAAPRTIVLSADSKPFPVVFEVLATTIVVPAHGRLRLDLFGPSSACLEVGYGANGVSVFRDPDLRVEVFDGDGGRLDIAGW